MVYLMQDLEKFESSLKEYLAEKVRFALLFGSVLTDYHREDSDIDLAIFVGKSLDGEEFLQFKHDLEKHFQHEYEFDVVILDTADPIIAMQALREDRLILYDSWDFFVEYKAKTINMYLDFKMSRRGIEESLVEGSVYDE